MQEAEHLSGAKKTERSGKKSGERKGEQTLQQSAWAEQGEGGWG